MRALPLTFAGALLLSTSALADPGWIQRADLNGDGVVTPAEAQRHEYLVMAELDKNDDGVITKSEWNKRPDFRFEYADFDNNNVLTAAEIHNGYVSGFRYYGVASVPGYPLPYETTTTTTTYPVAKVYSYTYYPDSYQGAVNPPVAAIPVAAAASAAATDAPAVARANVAVATRAANAVGAPVAIVVADPAPARAAIDVADPAEAPAATVGLVVPRRRTPRESRPSPVADPVKKFC